MQKITEEIEESVEVQPTFTLSDDQEEAVRHIKTVFSLYDKTENSSTIPYLVLEGEAGTGKTTVMEYVHKDFPNTLFAAPTNAAASVLETKVGTSVITIHKILGLQPGLDLTDFDPLNPKFVFKSGISDSGLSNYQLLIIDECSMINDALLKILMSKPIPILFVGDRMQLRPVKNKSIALVFDALPVIYLTTVQRQKKDSLAYQIAQKARKGIYNEFNSINDIDLETLDCENLTVLVYKNNRIDYWTKLLRSKLQPEAYFPNGKIKNKLLVGEKLLFRQDNQYYEIKNNQVYTIESITPTSQVSKNGDIIYYKNVVLSSPKRKFTVKILSPASYEDFSKVVGETHLKCTKRLLHWSEYYRIKNYFLIQDDLTYQRKKVAKADFQYNYCCTVHKSQGGTFSKILVDLENILTCKDSEVKKELITVACSRASDSTYIYNPKA